MLSVLDIGDKAEKFVLSTSAMADCELQRLQVLKSV